MYTLLDFKCLECGKIFEELVDKIAGCPYCSSTSLEQIAVVRKKTKLGENQPKHSSWPVKHQQGQSCSYQQTIIDDLHNDINKLQLECDQLRNDLTDKDTYIRKMELFIEARMWIKRR